MAEMDLTLSGYREYHDVAPVQGGLPKTVTRVTYYLGAQGPFRVTYDTDPSPEVVQAEITARRAALQQKLLA